jgi:hypothetical protein
MLAIVNVSPVGTPPDGPNEYEVRINRWTIATFTHERTPQGAAQCLRDAADAVEKRRKNQQDAAMVELLSVLPLGLGNNGGDTSRK